MECLCSQTSAICATPRADEMARPQAILFHSTNRLSIEAKVSVRDPPRQNRRANSLPEVAFSILVEF